MKRVKIRETGPLALEMTFPHRKKKTERLAITDPFYPRTKLAIELFRSLGTMQLVAPYLPEIIDTEFPIGRHFADIIEDMYRSCGYPLPKMHTAFLTLGPHLASLRRAVISHSSGKDSLHSVMWAQEEFGSENVLPVHISGLNTSNAKGEREYAFRQREKLGWPYFREVQLMSSAKCTRNGYQVMRSRDFFMTGILVPVALAFDAGRIITEGFAEALTDEPFTGKERNMLMFNSVLRNLGIPVEVAWKNIPEMKVIRQVYEERPGWMEHVHNCFARADRKGTLRQSWERRTPSWPLYDSQCGSCVKCRITRLGQLTYDREGMAHVKPEEVRVFLKDTATYTVNQWKKWARGDDDHHRDMLGGSFLKDLAIALSGSTLMRERMKLQADLERYEELFKERNKKKKRSSRAA